MLTDYTDRIIDKNSPAYITLITFREAAKKFFGFKQFPMIQTQDVKRELRRGVDDANQKVNFDAAYAYFSIQEVGLVKDRQAIKTLARHSMGMTFDELTNATAKKAFMFPAVIRVECHYVTKDLVDAMNFTTRALVTGLAGKLNAQVELEGVSWFVSALMESETIPFPKADKDSEQDPEGIDLSFSMLITTNLGAIRDVPKVNNYGRVDRGIGLKGDQP